MKFKVGATIVCLPRWYVFHAWPSKIKLLDWGSFRYGTVSRHTLEALVNPSLYTAVLYGSLRLKLISAGHIQAHASASSKAVHETSVPRTHTFH